MALGWLAAGWLAVGWLAVGWLAAEWLAVGWLVAEWFHLYNSQALESLENKHIHLDLNKLHFRSIPFHFQTDKLVLGN